MYKKLGTVVRQLGLRLQAKCGDEAGAELVEAALVLPILLMLLLGIVAFGRAYNVYQTITRAAREGARELVLTTCATCSATGTYSYSASQIENNFVIPAIEASNIDANKIKNYKTTYVYLDPDDPTPYICGVQISFDYPYNLDIPFTTQRLSTLTLSTKVQMRLENQPSSCSGSVP